MESLDPFTAIRHAVHWKRLVDSPWFWLFLYGGMAFQAVLAIGPKHELRQARIDRMQEARDRVHYQLDAEQQAAPADASKHNGERPMTYTLYSFGRLAMFTGVLVIYRHRRSPAERAALATAESRPASP